MRNFFQTTLMAALLVVPALANAKALSDPELTYSYLANSLPGMVEHAGGLSAAINLREIQCAVSKSRRGERPTLTASCTALSFDCATMTVKKGARDLALALMNSGLEIDRGSEPGTTYVSGKNLECMRMECKSSDPSRCENVPVEHSCDAD